MVRFAREFSGSMFGLCFIFEKTMADSDMSSFWL